MTNPRVVFLIAVAAALAGYWGWTNPEMLQRAWVGDDAGSGGATLATPPTAAVDRRPVHNPVASLTVSDLPDMVERPLFNPSRAPPPPPPLPAPPPEPVVEALPPAPEDTTGPDDFTLIGVGSRNGQWTAVIRTNATKEVSHLKIGEALDGWTMKAADIRTVTLSNGERSFQLALFVSAPKDAAGAPLSEDLLSDVDPSDPDQ